MCRPSKNWDTFWKDLNSRRLCQGKLLCLRIVLVAVNAIILRWCKEIKASLGKGQQGCLEGCALFLFWSAVKETERSQNSAIFAAPITQYNKNKKSRKFFIKHYDQLSFATWFSFRWQWLIILRADAFMALNNFDMRKSQTEGRKEILSSFVCEKPSKHGAGPAEQDCCWRLCHALQLLPAHTGSKKDRNALKAQLYLPENRNL